MTKYIDQHTILTLAIIAAVVALLIARVEVPEWLMLLAAALSPGLVFRKPESKPEPEP